MHPPITTTRLCRVLPTHELNARRARKQVLARLPALKVSAPPPSTTPTPKPIWVPGWGMPYE